MQITINPTETGFQINVSGYDDFEMTELRKDDLKFVLKVWLKRQNKVAMRKAIIPQDVVELVTKEISCTLSELSRGSGRYDLMDYKRIACSLIRKYSRYSTPQIEKLFLVPGWDHATTLYHSKKCNDYLDIDDDFREKYEYFENKLLSLYGKK